MAQELRVILCGHLAGTVRTSGTQVYFEYDVEYLNLPDSVPLSISVPLQEGQHVIGAWIEGLLSDNLMVRERWQQEFQAASTNAIDLLASPLGRDCAGAVQFCLPSELETVLTRAGGTYQINDQDVAKIIMRLREDEAAWSQGIANASFSLAGAQAKVALRHNSGKWALPYGSSPTSHILKVGVSRFPDSDIIEHLSQRTALLLGINVAETQCVSAFGNRAELVTRYDRIQNSYGEYERIHQEDFCQALSIPANIKYENKGGPGVAHIAGILHKHSSNPAQDARLFRDGVIYNWLICGTDAHAKNYSLLLHRKQVRLAPLYDICSILPYVEQLRTSVRNLKLAMRVGKTYSIYKSDYSKAWKLVSRSLGLPIAETMSRIVELAKQLPEALEQAVDELEPQFREPVVVSKLVLEITKRSKHCIKVPTASVPVWANIRPTKTLTQQPTVQTAPKPISRQRCTHIGVRTRRRCTLTAGHESSHRY